MAPLQSAITKKIWQNSMSSNQSMYKTMLIRSSLCRRENFFDLTGKCLAAIGRYVCSVLNMASGSLGSRRQNHRCYGSAATEFVLRDGGSFLSTLNVVSGQFFVFVFAKAPLFALDPALAAGLLFFFDFLLSCSCIPHNVRAFCLIDPRLGRFL